MRIAVGGFFHESNTFVRRPTTLDDYAATRLYAGAEMLAPLRGTDTELGGFIHAAPGLSMELVPTSYAWAWPGGPLTEKCFRTILDRLKHAVRQAAEGPGGAAPLDGMLLSIHGAMVVEGDDDPDGTILAEVRSCLGPGVPLVVTFDLHSNLSPLMVSSCTALLGYRTYPHVDLRDTGIAAAELLARTLRGEVQPVMALAKPPLMPHISRQRTSDGPMAAMMSLARAAEQEPGVLRADVAAGFPYADVPRMGMGLLVTTDADFEMAAHAAEGLAEEAWARRADFTADLPDAAAAVSEALSIPPGAGPAVIADIADNVGGGSPGDGTRLLAELMRQKAEGALVMLADPDAVAACIAAGVRAEVELSVGGKSDALHGEPVRVAGSVRRIADGIYRNIGPMRDGLVDDMGRTAVLECGGITLVLTERKTPMWNLEQLRSLGIEPTRLRVIVCKGAVAHRAAYEPIAARLIEAESPGACSGDVRSFEYRNIRRPLWPLDRW